MKVTECDNNYAISTKQLSEALSKSASTSRTFGVTLEENIGHITAIGAVTMESGAIIGNSLKTIYSRITTIPKAAEAIMDVGVAMETTSGDARRAQDIMADLAERWDGLSASQQQNIAVQTAGRYQLSRFLALMNNWDMATEATSTAITSQGSAMRENAQYLKSFEARLNILKNTFTELSSAMGEAVLSGGMLAVIEGLGALAKGAIFLVDKFGALPAVFLAVFAVMNKMDMFDKLKSRLMEVGEKAVDSIPVDEMKKRTNQVDDIVANSVNTQTQGNERISKSNEKVGESAKKAGRDTKIGMTEATVATRGFGIALKSALISTGIGVAFVGIGILIEQLIGKYQEQKTIMEEAEKLQKKQIDGYRTYDDGMKGVVGRFEELRNKTNRSNKEQQEYLKLQKEIATNIPTTVAYVDANGEAHMKSTEQIKKEIEAVKELSKEQAKASVAKFESDMGKKGEQYDEILEKISEVTKKTKELNKTNGKDELVNITGIGDKAQYVPVTRDNTKELKKSQVELMMLEAEKTKLFQKSAKLIQEQSFSYIEANGNMSKLGEQQKKVVENFVSQNEVMLRKSDGKKQFEANMEKLSELSKTVADTFIESYDKMDESLDKNDESRARKLEDYKGQMEAMAKALPDSFYKVADDTTGKVVKSNEQVKESIEGIVDVNKRVAGGETNIKKLQKSLEAQGLTAKQSKDFLHKFALENDNVKLKAELAKQGINAETTEIENMKDASLEAVDAVKSLFDYGSNDLSAIKSNIQNMQTLIAMYGDSAKDTESYKNSQEGLAVMLGKTTSEIEDQKEEIFANTDALEKANLGAFSGETREQLEKYINSNKELTKSQKDYILNLSLEKDAITGATTVLGYKEEEKRKELDKTKKKHKEVRDEVEKKPAKNGIKESIDETDKRMDDFKSKQQQALDSLNLPDMNVNVGVGYNTDDNSYSTVVGKNKQVADSYKEVENNKNAVNSKPSFNSEDISPEIMAGKVGMVADESSKAKGQIDNLKQGNTFNVNDTSPDVMIGKVKAVGDSFDKAKQKKDETNQSIMFNTQDTSSEVVKGQVDGVTKSMQKAKDKINEFKQSQIFPEASAGTDPTQARVDELVKAIEKAKDSMGILGTMQGEIDNTQNKLAKLLEQARNTASGVDSVSNKSKSIDHLKHSIERIVAVLSGSQEKIGGLFNGLEASASRVTEPVSSISSKIESIGKKASTARERTEKLVSTISKIGSGGVGNVKDYTQALGLMSGNLNLVASYGRTAVRQQTKIVDSFNQVISKAKAYNSAMASLSKNNGEAYARMDAKVRSATNSMKSSYEANKRALSSMSSFTQKSLGSVKNDFDKMSDDVTAKMTHMTTSMHLKFKSGIKGIVSTAGTIPAQIGKAIKDNMSDASTELDALARDMVKRFKSELGIHSPSRVFTKLGGHVIEGLVNGLSGGDLKSLGGEVFDDFGGGVFDSWDMIKAYVSGDFNNLVPSGGVGGGVQQWAGMATKALMMTGQYSESNLQKMLYQMQTESGGNAQAINLWDSNAKKGIPSKGLMQVIDPTFRAYAMPGFNKNVYDPLSNMLASIRYAVSRYGNLSSAYRGVGYAKGGLITEEHMAMVGEENKKEMVIPLERYRSRAIGLWEDAGDYLGIDPELLALIREQTSRGGGGMAYGGGGSFGASEGASGATGGGDSGTSGTIINATPTITPQILGGYNMDGEYTFSASAYKKKTYSKSSSKSSSKKKTTPKKKVNPREGIAEAFDYDAYDRMAKAQEAYLSLVQARSDALNKTTVSYRDSLKKIIGLQTTILASQKKELANTEREQKSIKKKLKDLPSLKKQTTKQREVYNKLMQDYDTNITKIQGLRSSIEENMRSVKNRSLDIFNDFIDSIVSKFDKSIESIKRKIDDTDFKIEVISLIKPDDKTASMNALVDKAKQQQELQATEQNKVNKLQDKYEDVRDKKGKESKSAKSAKKKLDKAKAVVQKKTATTKDKKAYASSQKRYEAIVDKEGKKSKKAKLAKAKLESAKRLAKKSPTKVNKLKVARYEKEYDKVVDVEGAKSKSARKEKVKMDALRKKATIKPSKKELDTYNKAKKTYAETVEREGNKSPEAKKAVEELRKAKEDLEDAQLATLQAEKAIKDARLEVANNGIDALKNYYGQMSEMAGKAYDLEIEKQTKAHQTKMENYDKEIQKVGDYYNELFAKMDEEKAKSNYEEELKSKTDKKAELVNKIAVLSRDTSLEGRSKVKKLQEELATVNKDLSDFQSQKAEDDARKALEAQRDKKISDIEATKTKEDEAFNGEGGALEKLQKEKEAVQKKYDDIIKNEEHWAKIRELAQSGHFGTLTKELDKMDANVKKMQKGQFDGLSAGYKNLSADIKKQMQEILELDVDNLGLANKGVTGDVKETDKAKDYKITNGKVSNSKGTKVDTPDYVTPTKKKASPKKTTSKKKTPSKKKPAPKKKSSKKKPTPKKKASESKADRKITTAVSFRSKPDYGNNIIKTLAKDTKVDYLGMEKGWAKIKYGGKVGYVGSSFLKKFDTGGYTGNSLPKGGGLAVLHNKEIVLNKQDTKNILDVTKLVRGMVNVIPKLKRNALSSLTGGNNVNTTISYGDINVTVENGDKKKSKEIASEIISGLKKRGKK
ncbi:MAG: phage tail tape measure protein [Gammaproteobacteria bacterium]